MAISIIDLFKLDGQNGFTLNGTAKYDEAGHSVSSAGDVNGDGFGDVIVGNYNDGGSGNTSYVVFGKASGFSAAMNLPSRNGNVGFRLTGNYEDIQVSGAGDINGDGFDDVIIGAHLTNVHGSRSGSSFVVFGKDSGFSATLSLADLNGSNGFRMDGVSAFDNFGRSVSTAGDINGDGFDDLIVSASGADPNGDASGSSYVVFGKDSGFSATLSLADLNGSNGFSLDGTIQGSGNSVSDAGDVNGDGFDDLIIGADGGAQNGISSGSSYVVFGKVSGFSATVNLSDLNGTNGFRLDGVATQDSVGRPVSSAGDVNGDGFDDLIVNAQGLNQSTGDSYVVFGKASGFSASFNLSDLNGSNGFRIDVAPYFSDSPVSGAGDVNGDGFDDVIIDAPGADHTLGTSYVVFGKASGFDAILDLSNPKNWDGIRFEGGTNFSGLAVSGAGDVNGDGFDDLIIGDTEASPNGLRSGASYVVFGGNDFDNVEVITGTPGNDKLVGKSAAEIFQAGAGNDSMLGRGGADQFFGDAGNDYIRVSDLDFKFVDGGIGKDTLALGGSGLNLNLANLASKIDSIENISLFGTGDNILTLTAGDVINISDAGNTLKVNGNAGDRIIGLSSGWEDGGIHGNFHTYTAFGGDAILLVGINVTTDFA